MRAMLLAAPKTPLREVEVPRPEPGNHQLLLKVRTCGVCCTDLHIVDGELEQPKFPLILGHQIVGEVADVGDAVGAFAPGDRVGVPWLGWTCGRCRYCLTGRENLCDAAKFTGYDVDGGYAEYAVADHRFCFSLPESLTDLHAAPLLRGLGTEPGSTLHVNWGLYGPEARTRLRHTRRTRRSSLLRRGRADPPRSLPSARGGTVVCGGIHVSEIPAFPYRLLWGERAVRSVANLTRQDADEFLALAPTVPLDVRGRNFPNFPLSQANEALGSLRRGELEGSAVLVVAEDG